MTSVFIGVVSHEGTRFADSQGPRGLAASLARELTSLGVGCTVVVNTRDAYDPETLPIDGALGWASVRAQLDLERAWDAYLAADPAMPARSTLRDQLVHALRLGRAALRFWRPWHGTDAVSASEIRLVRRLVNIELSHRSLMHDAIDSGAEWALIIEDDGSSSDIIDCALGIAGLVTPPAAAAGTPAYVNVSRSFGNGSLAIAPLLSPAPGTGWAGAVPRTVLSAARPVTDTVCAVLYRTTFLATLASALDALPMTPVVPIDWKLNAALMRLHADGVVGAGDCWLVEPGPIDQRSMG